jgi:predicted metalloendopeptidase
MSRNPTAFLSLNFILIAINFQAFQKLIDDGEVDEDVRIDGFLPWERLFITWAKTWREVRGGSISAFLTSFSP